MACITFRGAIVLLSFQTCIPAFSLAWAILFMTNNTLAETFSTPAIPVPGGRVSTQLSMERQEAFKLLTHKDTPEEGNEKSYLCQGCHGMTGNSSTPAIPKLAGQYKNYIIKQVRNFQHGKRINEIMSAMSLTVSDVDLYDAAAYFSAQETMQGKPSRNNTLGEKLFLNKNISKMGLACVNCHGERGKGLKPQISAFPIIGGQHKEYIQQQLINFRDGVRTNSPNNIMNKMTSSLTDTQIDALAKYISAQ